VARLLFGIANPVVFRNSAASSKTSAWGLMLTCEDQAANIDADGCFHDSAAVLAHAGCWLVAPATGGGDRVPERRESSARASDLAGGASASLTPSGGILPRRRRRLGARRCENLARSSRPKRYCAGIGSWWRASGPSLSVTDGPAADGPAPCRTDPADGKREPQLGLHAHPGGDGQPWPPTGPRDDSPDPERSRIEPAPARGKGMPWSVFLKAHWRGVGGCRLLFG